MAILTQEQKKRYEEQDRLLKQYNAARQEWFQRTLELCPPEMMKILRYVREMPESAEDDFLRRIYQIEWIMQGHPDIRFMLLRVIARRVDKQGGELDDPLPPDTNMFFKARQMLQVR